MAKKADPSKEPLFFKVLGRTLEHFGVQMYKRREIAIAELVANCWDAGARCVFIDVPTADNYNQQTSKIVIRDTGHGMDHGKVQAAYLVLGRNKRKLEGEEVQACLPLDFGEEKSKDAAATPSTRRVMGRKGIGKLAGFGLAKKMTVKTWQADEGLEFYLDLDRLKLDDNESKDVAIEWKWIKPDASSKSGTIVTLEALKHKDAMDIDSLRASLARRFSRTVRGEMEIQINGGGLPDPTPKLDKREPADDGKFTIEKLSDGNEVRYWYGYAEKPVHYKELRGFTIMVHGKVAQAPPFFFDVEAKASGQHATKYLLGEIEADFVDNGCDDESDLVSTDRQEIDWEAEKVAPLKKWGEELVRKLLIDCTKFKGEKTENEVLANPILKSRVERLEKQAQKQIRGFLRILGGKDDDDGRTNELADALVRAFEFRQFHDVIADIEEAAKDPNQLAKVLQQIHEWKVLESRAILEIIKGRLDILDKFEKMLCNNAPETKSSQSIDNMHDLLGGNPWLLNPEWQVLAEEKNITKQLQDWGRRDLKASYDGRYDFLAIGSDGLLVIIEIKRAEHPAELSEMNKLKEYANDLALAHSKPIKMVFICGRDPKISKQQLESFESDPHYEIRYWHQLFERTRKTYEHYRVILEGSVNQPGFAAKTEEIQQTRKLLEKGIHRPPEVRADGIPAQDVNYKDLPKS